jgi:GH25 family lysozyme M1 (1,4-beta-N-acetylmuramidase)
VSNTSRHLVAVAALAGTVLLGIALPQAAHAAPGRVAAPSPSTVAPPDAQQEEGDHAGSGLAARTTAPAMAPAVTGTLKGLDVSGYQGNVNWASVAAAGASFAYVKATESNNYISGYFNQQYNGSVGAGLIRGAYHFARPNVSSGTNQADYFVAHGGGWTADGKTLPGALDIEYGPSGSTCYGLSQSSMVSWITAFITEYVARTGRYPAIYSTTDWWRTCTGNYSGFAGTDALWIANYSGSYGTLPSGWSSYTIWQTADSGTFPGDQDVFNGSVDDLKTFALGSYTPPPPPPVVSWPLVQQGQTGRQVTTVQYLLNAHGAALDPDGDFGPATKTAVVSFQSSKGLQKDGIVGANTWQALVVTVQQGSTGAAVDAVQAELNAHGASLPVNGVFDAGTAAAVESFQSSKGLDPDGVVGPDTWQSLVS